MDLSTIYILVFAFLLDLILGDPKKLPHLIIAFGNNISLGEKLLNKNNSKFLKGALLTILLVSTSFITPYLIIKYLNAYDFQYIAIAFFCTYVILLFSQ